MRPACGGRQRPRDPRFPDNIVPGFVVREVSIPTSPLHDQRLQARQIACASGILEDCTVAAAAMAGAVLAYDAAPTIRSTWIHDGPGDSLLAQPGRAGTIEASKIRRNVDHGIVLIRGSNMKSVAISCKGGEMSEQTMPLCHI